MEPGGYFPSERLSDCSTWNKSSFQYVKYGTGSSPSCSWVSEKSMERRRSLGGVPVLSRPSSRPISFNELESPKTADSPARPPDCCVGPTCISPRKNVPV